MKRLTLILSAILVISVFRVNAAVTIEDCVEKALANYPVIKKYDLLSATRELDLSDINKSWLPRVNVYGQGTVQNVVPAFPDALADVLDKLGQNMRGLGKLQYRVGVDVSQTIWDGGASRVRREMANAMEDVQRAKLDVELYQVKQRVENAFFAILLTDAQIEQSRITYALLCDNLEKLKAMLRNGTAMQSDVDMVESQALTVNQNIEMAKSAVRGYRKILELYTGESLSDEPLAKPSAEIPSVLVSNRPELKLFDRQQNFNGIQNRMTDVSLMPRVGFFTQAYYGYPGFNYFKSMMKRDMSFNILAGVKISWDIDSFYSKKNAYARTALKEAEISADRDIFLFNSGIQTETELESIRGIKSMIKDDARIVELKMNVRKAAESQLDNGIIDITSLLTKISEENASLLTSQYHEIMLLQSIYKLKYILDI